MLITTLILLALFNYLAALLSKTFLLILIKCLLIRVFSIVLLSFIRVTFHISIILRDKAIVISKV